MSTTEKFVASIGATRRGGNQLGIKQYNERLILSLIRQAGALTKADIASKTPYNTYRIDGLPPGPIANPGRAALEAVLNPRETPHLYFVADGSGGHAFSASLEEHNRNVRAWRKRAGAAAAATVEDSEDLPAVAAPAVADAADQPLAGAVPEPDTVSPQPPEVAVPDDASALKPGAIVIVDGRPVPIPRLRPLR